MRLHTGLPEAHLESHCHPREVAIAFASIPISGPYGVPADSSSVELLPDPTLVQQQLKRVHAVIEERALNLHKGPVASTKDFVERCLTELPADLPSEGLGLTATTSHLLETIAPALMPGQAGPRCFGLVIGGVTPAAQIADELVASYDPCVQVHWPAATASVALEGLALSYLLSLLSLPFNFSQNTFTTGATASNILGLALGRDWTIATVKHHQGVEAWSVSEDGFGGVEVDVFIADAHASVRKAAALVGIGRRNVVELGDGKLEAQGRLICFDLARLEERLADNVEKGRGSIIATSFGEVNTGAINRDTPALRTLADKYGAWLHIDAAFGAFAVLHPEFEPYKAHLALGDSITSDAHKWLNVPYDCGLFFSRPKPFPSSTTSLFNLTGPGANAPAYLTTPSAAIDSSASLHPKLDASRPLPSPLFMNIENSRRLRALPVLASLLSSGREGYASLIQRNITFARQVESLLRSHSAYDVLTPPSASLDDPDPFAFRILNVVLFAPSSTAPARYRVASADNPDPAATFLNALNESNEIFLTGTAWRGRKAVRLAVSNWLTELEEGREWKVVERVLERVMEE
ncbi:hypothetical protein JCM11641_006649 [Rhodosporidiobolus odoratus]